MALDKASSLHFLGYELVSKDITFRPSQTALLFAPNLLFERMYAYIFSMKYRRRC